MKKTLIALAVAALPVAAMADVTLYGTIKGGVEFTKVKSVDGSITNINDWDSYVGIKGEEDLGNGLKAIWQLEKGVSIAGKGAKRNSGDSMRDTFIGLATPFGKLRAGYLSDQFNANMETPDAWEGLDFRTLSAYTRTSGRYTGVRYDSPNFAGFDFNLLYVPGDNEAAGNALAANEDVSKLAAAANTLDDKRIFSIGLNYENSGFFGKYGYLNARAAVAPDSTTHVHRAEFGYDANNIYAALGYQYTKNFDGLDVKTQEIALTGGYTFGNITPKITYAYGKVKDAKHSKYHQVIVGADYALSKRTTVVGNVAWVKAGDNSLYNHIAMQADKPTNNAYAVGLGLVHKF